MQKPKISDYTKDLLASYDQLSDFSCNQDKYIDQLEAEKKWICVEDRLPEVGKSCLCYGNVDYIEKGYFYGGTKVWYTENQKVTHWMPLPEPPKQ